MRVGLLGGSFNPAHDGHLHVSRAAMKVLGLHSVWWLVSPQNPLKPVEGMAAFPVRQQNARAIVRDRRIMVTAIETTLGTNYTVDTLAALRVRFPGVRFVWLMGSDNLLQVPRWKNWKAIFRLVPIAVVARPGTALGARTGFAARMFHGSFAPPDRRFPLRAAPAWTIIDARRSDASATRLRAVTA